MKKENKQKLKHFWHGVVLNPWSYAMLGAILVPILLIGFFFFSVLFIIEEIVNHPEAIGEWFGRFADGFNKAN